jgi:glutamate dehydrogenase
LDAEARVALLMSMTDDVGRHVLADNYAQNVMLGVGRASAANLVGVHRRMISELEAAHLLDRALEFLPTDQELAAREAAHGGLVSPELCVLLAYAKISLVQALSEGGLADDAWYSVMLRRYFPAALAQQYDALLDQHPLRTQIINTVACNGVLALGGISFVFRAMEETGASAVDVVKAATVIIETFGLQDVWDRINALDNLVAASQQDRMHLEFRRLLDRGTRWILQSGGGSIDVAGQIERLAPFVEAWLPRIPQLLQGVQKAGWTWIRDGFVEGGAPVELAEDVVSLLEGFPLLDLASIAALTGESQESLVPLYYAVFEHYQVDAMLTRISSLRRADRWDTLARLALRSDLYAVAARLVEGIARSTDASAPLASRIAEWEARNAAGIARAKVTLGEIDALEAPSLASMSVLLRVMRNLAAG